MDSGTQNTVCGDAARYTYFMNEERTSDELDAIWDDESGTPMPLTAAQMDARLAQHTAARREERLAFEEQTTSLQELIAQYKTVVEELQKETHRSPETIHLRNNLLRLAKRSLKDSKGF